MKNTLTLPIVLLLASCARIENTSQMKRTAAELPGTANLRSVSNVVVLASPGVSAKLPPHKQWKLVFSDEFEGDKLDDSKWKRRADGTAFIWNGAKGRRCDDYAEVDGKGLFVLKVTRDADGTFRWHPGIETKGKFQQTYGYFETRVRFTREPGWWGAVWLYGVEVGPNPFLMGQEIDIFEDFYKPKKKAEFAHNVHFDAQLAFASEDNKHVGKLDGDRLYRVSRGKHDVAVADWNTFHVVGVEWTPLEYIFYCDGKETFRLDYKQVPATTQPMHLLITGNFRDPNRAKFQGDYADGHWPDQLTVDYVRVYQEDPGTKQKPKVALRLAQPARTFKQDEVIAFHVDANDADGNVASVLLFSNGRIRAEQSAASATFTLPAKQLYRGDNILIAMARDNDGLTGLSEPLRLEVLMPGVAPATPYLGKAQSIPGKITAGYYDEGGAGAAYFSYYTENSFGMPPWNKSFRTTEHINTPDQSGIAAGHRGLWVNYSVDIREGGDYRVIAMLARPDAMAGYSDRDDRILLEIDGQPLTEFVFSPALTTGKAYWSNYHPLPAQTVRLPAGRHVLRVRFEATPFNFGGLQFDKLTGRQPETLK